MLLGESQFAKASDEFMDKELQGISVVLSLSNASGMKSIVGHKTQ